MADERTTKYAEALASVAQAEGQSEQVADELFQVAQAMDSSDELRRTLGDASLPLSRRTQVVEDLLGPKASPVTTSLVSMVVGAGRGGQLSDIIRESLQVSAGRNNRAVAEVRTAVPLDDEQRTRLAAAIAKATGKEVDIRAVVDPSVQGGVVARIGDTVIDGSVRRKLAQLREAI